MIDPGDPPQTPWGWIWIKWFSLFYRWVKANLVTDYGFEVARGAVNGVSGVNKFGRVLDNVDSGVQTDVWDGAISGGLSIIWVAPTAARIHALVSTSANDADAGTGAYSVTVYGLTDWDTAEVKETKTLTGTTPVNTDNSYVIIHRMVANYGANSTGANAGTILATAAAPDSTGTAAILVGQGQSEMAIYGVPSIQTIYIKKVWGSVNRAIAGAVNVDLLINPNPDVQLFGFNRKGNWSVHSTGSTTVPNIKDPPEAYAGPCIVKLQASGSANNMDVSAGFDAYLETN